MRLFRKAADFAAMEKVLEDALRRTPVRLLAYCILSNHWHLLLWPRADGELSEFMRWLTLTHTQRWHANRHTSGTGPIYQGRFKSFPVQSDEHLLTVARYIERNPLRAGMVENVEQWQWSSLWRRCQADAALCEILSDWPVQAPRDWSRWVQQPQTEAELQAVRRSVLRGRPFGEDHCGRFRGGRFRGRRTQFKELSALDQRIMCHVPGTRRVNDSGGRCWQPCPICVSSTRPPA
jgi:putative transposase